MTRLRITVHNPELVGKEAEWKQVGAMGFIAKGTGIQAIYGPKADVLNRIFKICFHLGLRFQKSK